MEDELLKTSEEVVEVFSSNEGFSVTNTGVILGLRCNMDVQEVSVVKGSDIDIRVIPSPGIANCPKLSWYSSDSSVAYVDDMLSGNGICECGLVKIYTRGLGTATITASSESGLTCSLVINVVEVTKEEEKEEEEGEGIE